MTHGGKPVIPATPMKPAIMRGADLISQNQNRSIYAASKDSPFNPRFFCMPKVLFQFPMWMPTWRRNGSTKTNFYCEMEGVRVSTFIDKDVDAKQFKNESLRLDGLSLSLYLLAMAKHFEIQSTSVSIDLRNLLKLMGHPDSESGVDSPQRINQALFKLINTKVRFDTLYDTSAMSSNNMYNEPEMDFTEREQYSEFSLLSGIEPIRQNKKVVGYHVDLDTNMLRIMKKDGEWFHTSLYALAHIARAIPPSGKRRTSQTTAKLVYLFLLSNKHARRPVTTFSKNHLRLMSEYDNREGREGFRYKSSDTWHTKGRIGRALETLESAGLISNLEMDKNHDVGRVQLTDPRKINTMKAIRDQFKATSEQAVIQFGENQAADTSGPLTSWERRKMLEQEGLYGVESFQRREPELDEASADLD